MKAGVIQQGERVRSGFHNFRHSLATALVKLKVDPKTVPGMLRHEDFGTTMQLYAQSDMEAMRDAQGKFLEQLLGDRIHLLTERVQLKCDQGDVFAVVTDGLVETVNEADGKVCRPSGCMVRRLWSKRKMTITAPSP